MYTIEFTRDQLQLLRTIVTKWYLRVPKADDDEAISDLIIMLADKFYDGSDGDGD